jgi:hypothetical protein
MLGLRLGLRLGFACGHLNLTVFKINNSADTFIQACFINLVTYMTLVKIVTMEGNANDLINDVVVE